jgi:hypothetical protein
MDRTGLARIAGRAAAEIRDRSAAAVRDVLRSARTGIGWAWARRPPAPRAVAILFAVGTAAVSAWAILAQARLPSRLPTALDWAAARALVERDGRGGDAVALSPPWAERARELLPASVPVLVHTRYAGEDLVGVRRVWLLALPEAPRSGWDLEVDLLERAVRSDVPARLGAIEVTRHDLASPTLPLAFLPDRLPRATVSLGDARCPPDPSGRFRCGDDGASASVERSVREVQGMPRPCVAAASPAALGAPLVVEFPAARLGRTLQGHAGSLGGSSPIRIAVQLDGDEIGAAELSEPGWTAFRIDTTRSAGQVRPLAIVLTSPGPLAVCLDALVLP